MFIHPRRSYKQASGGRLCGPFLLLPLISETTSYKHENRESNMKIVNHENQCAGLNGHFHLTNPNTNLQQIKMSTCLGSATTTQMCS